MAFYPRGPWHAGKFMSMANWHDNNIVIDGDMTGCYVWEDPFIRNWHRTNMASDHPTEFPFSQYQILPIDRTMGNFTKSPQHYQSEVPDYRFLDTVYAPGHKASSQKYWGRDHSSNM